MHHTLSLRHGAVTHVITQYLHIQWSRRYNKREGQHRWHAQTKSSLSLFHSDWWVNIQSSAIIGTCCVGTAELDLTSHGCQGKCTSAMMDMRKIHVSQYFSLLHITWSLSRTPRMCGQAEQSVFLCTCPLSQLYLSERAIHSVLPA